MTGSGEDNAATGDLDIKSNLVMYAGSGRPARVSANGLGDRVFDIIQPTTRTISVTLINIWMSNGTAIDYGGGMRIGNGAHVTLSSLQVLTNTVTGQNVQGGGIYAGSSSTLTLNSVLVRANHVQGSNNGSARGGGISSNGKLVLNASTILSNVVTSSAPTDNISGYGGGIDIGCCPGTLDVNDSTIFGSSIVLGSAAQFVVGGGINGSGFVTVTHSTISGNSLSATGSNATVIEGGGLYVNGRLNLLTSTVANNSVIATNPSLGMHGGGLVFNFHAQIISSTIDANSVRVGSDPAGYGGGISFGGFYYNADLLLDRSIVSSNVANDGGGINSDISTTMAVRNSLIEYNLATNGAGIFNLGVLTVTNSTLFLNAASKSGGGLYNSQTANVNSATFFANVADYDADNLGDGGGIFAANGTTLYLRNSLLTGEEDRTVSGNVLPDCAGTIISQNYNLIQQSSSPTGCNIIGSTSHDLHGTFVGVLDSAPQDNGGNTPTIALPPGSAAIDAGDPTGCKDENGNPLTTDQRGYPRVGPCDIGAYELSHYALTVASTGTGGGVVTPTVGVYTYTYNTIVTPTASANTGSTFTGWSGACSGTGLCVVTVTTNKAITANFALKTYTLTIAKTGTGSGVVTPTVGVYTYIPGTIVTVTASANLYSFFSGWSGNCSGLGACVVTMTTDRSAIANFNQHRIYLPLVLKNF